MNLTIKDIAKMAGVSQGTVSKIMNNYSGISEETKKRVLDIIDKTGYQPTFSAKALATKKSNLIGLIYAGKINVDFTHPYFNEVVTAFKKTIGLLGYDMIMFSNEKFTIDKGSYIARCRHYNVDGCVIIAGEKIEAAIYDLVKAEIPSVGIDIQLNGPKASYVMSDNIDISRKVIDYFYLQGISDIGFIGGMKKSEITKLREKGYKDSLAHYGISFHSDWVKYGDYKEESGYHAMMKILQEKPYPKAIFAISDNMALGAIKAIKEKGLNVPDDIRVIGCDDIDACRYHHPKLTTVKQNKAQIGSKAAYMLNDLIHNKLHKEPKLIDAELMIRET